MTGLDGLPVASAVVLAGGRSSRFGRDKLAEPLGGRPLLEYAILAAGSVTRDVVVIGAPVERRLPAMPGVTVRVAADAEPFAGPLVALATALELVREPLALVVAGDMPTLVPSVLAALLRSLDAADGLEATALLFRSRRQPLPMALRVGAATLAVGRNVAGGDRSLQSLLSMLRTKDLDETEWRSLDPGAATLRDVDRPEDLPR